MVGSIAPDAARRTAVARADAWVGRSISERFDQIAAESGNRVAIRTPHGEIRYGALAALSDRIAFTLGKRLAQRRVPAPTPIAVLLPQGIAAIAAQLGILKAGACYVPLDPRHPPAHLLQAIEHAEAPLVVTNSKLAGLAERMIGDARVLVDIDDISRWGSRGAPKPVPADSLAYLYYTSGSSGRPKGVADTHRNVLHNIYRYTRNLGIVGDDRLSLVQSPAFSGVVSSTYAALLNGAMVCPYDLHEDGPQGLADWLVESGVTIYHSVPTLFRRLVAGRRSFPAMRIVRLEGDRALWGDAALFRAHFPPTAILANGLGTTETGIVRQFLVSRDTPLGEGLLPVGYAVPDVEVHVVDDAGERVAANAIGEIVVQSRYLAVGYWKDPERTAERFRSGGDGERSYRTGDLGRMRSDGCVEHLGRRDDIIRIRGQSVDPSLVEAALASVPGVGDAAATSRERTGSESELVAFVTASGAMRPAPAAIATALRERLPDAMVPTTIVVLDQLPVTPFAKIDRAAVAALAANLAPTPHDSATPPPASPLEEEVARIWGEVLARAGVPGNVAFLETGGDSLQAMEILVRFRERLGVDMSVADFFALPTVASQARFLEGRTTVDGAAALR